MGLTDGEDRDGRGPGALPARPPAPDVVITLHRPGHPPAWVLVEAVGPDGLSGVDGRDDPGARLAAHWMAAQRASGPDGAPLALVLVTSATSVPGTLFAWARAALRRAGEPPAPFYGLSWRSFAEGARSIPDPPLVLSDLLDLLEGAWGLAEVAPMPWPPVPDPCAAMPFRATVRWPVPAVDLPALSLGGVP